MPYLMEAVTLVSEGVPTTVIDKRAKEFGMPMGPVELADVVGLDVCLSVAENLTQHFGGEVPAVLKAKVKDGALGRKTGRGFYQYKKGKPVKPVVSNEYKIPEDIQRRLIMRMIDEAKKCLEEGIVASADQLDAGMIFGTGFAPFRGGPLHYASQLAHEKT